MRPSAAFPRLSLVALALLQHQAAQASAPTHDTALYHFRGTGQFLSGSDQQLGGFGDGMYPLWQRPNQVFFVDGSALFGQSQLQTYSGGLGYRRIYENTQWSGIWGAYSFIDSFHTDKRNTFWLLNPGVEWLSTAYEGRLQGYLPLNGRTKGYQTATASNLPQDVLRSTNQDPTNFFGVKGRSLFDSNVALVEQLGPGFELELGKSFTFKQMKFGQEETNRAWVRVGAYHFAIQNNKNVTGVQANIEAPLNRKLSLIVQNNYDNQNDNRFAIGLRASFGGSDAPINTIQSRMMAPIIRHQARQSYGDAVPKRLNFKQQNEFSLIDNGWFFSPTGSAPKGLLTTQSDCTADNPCSTIDSDTALRIQQLDPQATFLFATGAYVIPEDGTMNRIANLQDGQRVSGRETGWFNAASGANRPNVAGGFFWGDNATSPNATGYIENMVVTNNNQVVSAAMSGLSSDAAIAVGAMGDITAINTDSSTTHNTTGTTTARANGIISVNSNATVQGGTHFTQATSVDGIAFSRGIQATQNVTVNSAELSSEANATGNGIAAAQGVVSFDAVNISGGNYSGQATSFNGDVFARGIQASVTAIVNNANTSGAGTSTGTGAVFAQGVFSGDSATISGGNHTASASTVFSDATASGVFASQTATVAGASTAGTASADSGNVFADGITAFNSDANVSGGVHQAQATTVSGEANARGIRAIRDANVTGANTSGVARSTSGIASADGVLAFTRDANVFGGVHSGLAESTNAGANARGVRAERNATVTDANTSATQTSGSTTVNEGFAEGINARVGDAIVSGGTHTANSSTITGLSDARGVRAGNDVTLTNNASTIANATSTGSANSTADSVLAFNNANVTGGTHSGFAQTVTGNAIGRGVFADQNAVITNATTSGVTESTDSGSGSAFSEAITGRNGSVVVSGGTHSAQATSANASVGTQSTANGVFAGTTATINDATISATASSILPADAIVTGILGTTGGTVTNSSITVSGTGTSTKCSVGVTSPDGSCS